MTILEICADEGACTSVVECLLHLYQQFHRRDNDNNK